MGMGVDLLQVYSSGLVHRPDPRYGEEGVGYISGSDRDRFGVSYCQGSHGDYSVVGAHGGTGLDDTIERLQRVRSVQINKSLSDEVNDKGMSFQCHAVRAFLEMERLNEEAPSSQVATLESQVADLKEKLRAFEQPVFDGESGEVVEQATCVVRGALLYAVCDINGKINSD